MRKRPVTRRAVLTLVLIILMHPLRVSGDDDLASLKEIVDLGVKAINAQRPSLLAAIYDRQIAIHAPNTSPIVGRAQCLEYLRNLFLLFDEYTVQPTQTDFQIAGDTAVVTSNYVISVRPKERRRAHTILTRVETTYKKSHGEWRATEIHSSTPLLPVAPIGELAERPGFFWE